jgi:hypothetical protein
VVYKIKNESTKMKLVLTICLSVLLFKTANARLLIVKNTKATKVKTSYFESNSSLKCFVIEVYDKSKNKFIFIRHYFRDSLNKQKLEKSNNYNENYKTIFEQIDYNNKLKRNEKSLFESVITYDTLILIYKSKTYLITGDRIFVELFEFTKNKETQNYTTWHNLNENLKPIGYKDSLQGIEAQIGKYNYLSKWQFGNFLIYKLKGEIAFLRAEVRVRDAETNYTNILIFKRKRLTTFSASYCKIERFDVFGGECTPFMWFTKSKTKVQL